jgi:hypothetical protein
MRAFLSNNGVLRNGCQALRQSRVRQSIPALRCRSLIAAAPQSYFVEKDVPFSGPGGPLPIGRSTDVAKARRIDGYLQIPGIILDPIHK